MPVIDKERIQPACTVFEEDCLAVVRMLGADVNQPRHPKALVVADPLETVAGQNLQ
jgi:hypothetical protein